MGSGRGVRRRAGIDHRRPPRVHHAPRPGQPAAGARRLQRAAHLRRHHRHIGRQPRRPRPEGRELDLCGVRVPADGGRRRSHRRPARRQRARLGRHRAGPARQRPARHHVLGVVPAGTPPGDTQPRGGTAGPRAAGDVRRPGLAGLFRPPSRQGRHRRAEPAGGDRLSRRGLGLAGQRRPARRPRILGQRDRGVAGRVPCARLDSRRDERRRTGRDSVSAAGFRRPRTRRRGHLGSADVQPGRQRDASGPAGRAPRRAGGLRRTDPAARPGPRSGDFRDRGACEHVARRRDRAWLLDGAGPARRPG
jgi:hypothetical protein